jgi:hypothetical protein
MITIGLLIAAIVVNGTKDKASRASYQIPIGLQFIWGMVSPKLSFLQISTKAHSSTTRLAR